MIKASNILSLALGAQFIGVISCLAATDPSRKERPAEKAFKGMELYSWKNSKGIWIFSLLPGTNRIKTSIEIKEKQIPDAKELEKRFLLIAKGEQVFWLHPDLEDFGFPDQKIMDAAMSSAKKARIKLYVPLQKPVKK